MINHLEESIIRLNTYHNMQTYKKIFYSQNYGDKSIKLPVEHDSIPILFGEEGVDVNLRIGIANFTNDDWYYLYFMRLSNFFLYHLQTALSVGVIYEDILFFIEIVKYYSDQGYRVEEYNKMFQELMEVDL